MIEAQKFSLAWKRTRIFLSHEWKITWLFLGAHVVMVSVLGGAELERYLLPVLPLLYIAMGAALFTLQPKWRNAGSVTACSRIADRPSRESTVSISTRKQSGDD